MHFSYALFMHICPRPITTHAESINSDTAWAGQAFTTHTTLNTEQNQLAIKDQRITNTTATLVVKY